MKSSINRFPARIMAGIYALSLAIFAQSALAACDECGTVTDLKTVKIEGKGSGVGVVAGGVVGGLLGNQIGRGTGRDVATIGGVVGGAYVGNEVEKKSKARTQYRVIVEMENGTTQTFKYSSPTSFQIGDSVKVKKGKLTRP